MNKTGISPIEFKVLIKKEDSEKVSDGGIIIPLAAREKEKYAKEKATLIAKGSRAFEHCAEEEIEAMTYGTKVLVNKYSGMIIRGMDKEEYTICNDKDITAILEEKNE